MAEQPAVPTPMPQLDSPPTTPVAEPDPIVKTLADLEREIGAVHEDSQNNEPVAPTTPFESQQTPEQIQDNDAEAARKAVEAALVGLDAANPDPIVALNAQPLGGALHSEADSVPAPVDPFASDLPAAESTLVPDPAYARPESPSSFPGVMPDSHQEDEGEAAPPVPPPFVPPTA